MSERTRSARKFSQGRAEVSADLSVREPGSRKKTSIKRVEKTIQLGIKGGDAETSVNQGMTFTENFSGVRLDVRVTLPCNSDKQSILDTAKQAKDVGQELMPEIMSELREALAEVKSPKRDKVDYGG